LYVDGQSDSHWFKPANPIGGAATRALWILPGIVLWDEIRKFAVRAYLHHKGGVGVSSILYYTGLAAYHATYF
jgi:hypothetical protein